MSRLLDMTLPKRGWALVLYEAYFDETGDDGGFPLFGVGGYLIKPNKARKLEKEWNKVLKKNDVPYFHMVDVACKEGNGKFRGMPMQQRIDLQTECMRLIKKYVEISVMAICPLRRFGKNINHHGPYGFCFGQCLSALDIIVKQKHNQDFGLAVYYERGHKHGGHAYEHFRDNQDRYGNVTSFSDVKKEGSPMVQAADILVWQYAKYIKDMANAARSPRKDFLSLMDIPGYFSHLFPQADQSVVMVECQSDGVLSQYAKDVVEALYRDGPGAVELFRKHGGFMLQ